MNHRHPIFLLGAGYGGILTVRKQPKKFKEKMEIVRILQSPSPWWP